MGFSLLNISLIIKTTQLADDVRSYLKFSKVEVSVQYNTHNSNSGFCIMQLLMNYGFTLCHLFIGLFMISKCMAIT